MTNPPSDPSGEGFSAAQVEAAARALVKRWNMPSLSWENYVPDARAALTAAATVQNARLKEAEAVVEAARALKAQDNYHGEMYGCVQCYHARKPEDRCPEGRLLVALARYDGQR